MKRVFSLLAVMALFCATTFAQSTSVTVTNTVPCDVYVTVIWGACGGGEGCDASATTTVTYFVPSGASQVFPPPCPGANPGYFDVKDVAGGFTGTILFNDMFSCVNYSYQPDGFAPFMGTPCGTGVFWSNMGMGHLVLEII